MARRGSSKESKKKFALLGILLLLAVVVIYQVSQGPNPAPKRPSQSGKGSTESGKTAPAASAGPNRNSTGSQQPKDLEIQQLLADISPLDVPGLAVSRATGEIRRNIFAYYVKPPPPPEKPPPPPPIALRFIQPQTAIAGTPKPIPLTVTGERFPEDAQIILGGVPKPTKRISVNQLAAEIAPSDYSVARTINIEVKSQSKPVELYSNPVAFTAQPAPEPPVKFVGILGDLAVLEVNTRGVKDLVRLRRGDKIEGIWRIESISENGIEVTDVRYDVRKRIPL